MSESVASMALEAETVESGAESVESVVALTGRSMASHPALSDDFSHPDRFVSRHNGPRDTEIAGMAQVVGYESLAQLIDATVPAEIRMSRPLKIEKSRSEQIGRAHV